MADTIIACENCGQQNRLPAAPLASGKKIVCGRCAHRLIEDEDDTCPSCDGTGEVALDDDDDSDPMDCLDCGGTGKVGA